MGLSVKKAHEHPVTPAHWGWGHKGWRPGAITPMSQTCSAGSARQGGNAFRHFITLLPGYSRWRPSTRFQSVSMDQTSYKASFHLNTPKKNKNADLAADPDPSRKGYHPWQRSCSCAIQFAIGKCWPCEKVQQDEAIGNRQGQQQKLDKLLHLRWCYKEVGRGRRQWQCREECFFNRYLTEQDPSASFSNGCRRRGGKCKAPVHGPQREQPREACWQDHNLRRNQQQQGTELLLQDQADEQSGSGQEKMLYWNVRKHCWVNTLHMPAAMLREARERLRPMNMAGYLQSGMCAPHNTSNYIIDQHEYTWRIEEKEPEETPEGSANHSTVDGDFPLIDPCLPRPRRLKAHHRRGRGTAGEEHTACQD